MNTRSQIRILFSLVLTLALVWTIGAAEIAEASSSLPNGRLASDEVIDNDVFVTGQEVAIDGTINGDVFTLGNQVQINGKVNGSLFVIGQQVAIQGEVTGTTYVGAVSLELGPQAVLQRNLYFVGVSLTTQAGSTIQRDMNTLCLGADLKGAVAGNTRATIGILKVIQLIINGLGGEILVPQLNLRPGGMVPPGAAGGLPSIMLVHLFQEPTPAGSIDTAQLSAWLIDWLRDFFLLLVLSAVFYWMFRKPLERSARALRLRPLPALGYGLLALLIVVNIYLVGLLVASLVFVLGLWLGNLGLWSFTLAFWALTYAALAFFLAVLWFLVVYGTKIIVAYLASAWLFEKMLRKVKVHPFIVLVVGLLIYVLLRSIPMAGWVIGVLVTAWGLGGFWLAYRKVEQDIAT
jgi:cytoskeletal protein CcmA (bactofilin family)